MTHGASTENPHATNIHAINLREDLKALTRRQGIPANRMLGVLPIRRWIPQDIHSVGDYANSARVMAAGLLAKDRSARMASLALGVSGLMVSSLTDYRVSMFKVIPIEAHEAIDYLWGASAIAAPFVLGYHKRAKITAALHIAVGAAHIVTSLLTDYRAARGIGRRAERIGTAAMQGASA